MCLIKQYNQFFSSKCLNVHAILASALAPRTPPGSRKDVLIFVVKGHLNAERCKKCTDRQSQMYSFSTTTSFCLTDNHPQALSNYFNFRIFCVYFLFQFYPRKIKSYQHQDSLGLIDLSISPYFTEFLDGFNFDMLFQLKAFSKACRIAHFVVSDNFYCILLVTNINGYLGL